MFITRMDGEGEPYDENVDFYCRAPKLLCHVNFSPKSGLETVPS